MLRLADYNEDYHPSRLDWVLVQAKQLQREGSLCGCPEPPGNWRYPLLGLKVLRRFRASSGPLEGIVALHESTFESQGDIYSEESTSRGSGSSRRSIENICPSPFREINILELLFTCLIYRLLEGSNELSTHGSSTSLGDLTIG